MFSAAFKTIILIFSVFSVSGLCGQEQISEGVVRHAFEIPGSKNTVWVYHPNPVPKKKLPVILICPAGSRLFHGMPLTKGDEPEHIPYVKAGMVVVAYETSGQLEGDSEETWAGAFSLFREAEGGVVDAATALRAAVTRFPFLDEEQVFTVGHSSAGSTALSVAQSTLKLRGCVVYAPATQTNVTVSSLIRGHPDMAQAFLSFSNKFSPTTNMGKTSCPVMVFHAKDDQQVPSISIKRLVESLQHNLKSSILVEVETGGHYQSMVDRGIERGIAWIKDVVAGNTPQAPSPESRMIHGKSLTIQLLPGFKVYKNSERDLATDFYHVFWRSLMTNYPSITLALGEKDVAEVDIDSVVEKQRILFNKRIDYSNSVSKWRGAESKCSEPEQAPLHKGIFQGYRMSCVKFYHPDGSPFIESCYVLWDKKDIWIATLKGNESSAKKLIEFLELISFRDSE